MNIAQLVLILEDIIQRNKLIPENEREKEKSKKVPGISRPHTLYCNKLYSDFCSFRPVVSDSLNAAGTFRSIFALPWDTYLRRIWTPTQRQTP